MNSNLESGLCCVAHNCSRLITKVSACAISASREALWQAMERLGDPYAKPNRYGAKRYLPRAH